LLYKLGRLAFRRRHFAILIWLALLAIAGVSAAAAAGSTDNSFTIPGTEAQQASDLLKQRFPNLVPDGAAARMVFQAPAGQKITATDNKAVVEKAVGELTNAPLVNKVVDPFQTGAVSRNRSAAYVQVTYKVAAADMTDQAKAALTKAAQDARSAGLTVESGGTALQSTPGGSASEAIGIGIAAVVLLITFGSLVAAGLPLLSAIVGVGTGVALIAALAGPLKLAGSASSLAAMIGLAVGIDYALFIVSRYRAELDDGHEPEDAIGRAVGTAGSAVVFAGSSVVIALAGLSVVGVPFLTKMGLAAAGTVALSVLVALTLVPALLGFAGRKILSRKVRKAAEENPVAVAGQPQKPNAGTRWAQFVLRRPVAVLLTGVIGLGVIAVPVASLQLGLPDDGSQPTSTTQRRAYDLLSKDFGPGFNGPLTVVVDAQGATSPKAEAAKATKTITGLSDIASISPPVYNTTGDTALLKVVPSSTPSSTATKDLVHAIRTKTGDNVLVTGTTALNIDVSQTLNNALLPYLGLVVGLAFLMLMLVFRSILVPLKAALGFLCSVAAALGAVVAVFQWGWLAGLLGVQQTGPVMSLVPIFVIGVVFGLAMDYEVFLVTRMREAYVHGETPHQAIVTGFRHGARVVTAAAIIMIGVFAGFIGGSEAIIKTMGFGLAIAVFFDAFVVRMAIVPAVLALLGKAAWWLPGWLDKALPNVDVEGEQLRHHLTADTAGEPGRDKEPQPSNV
jgi:RND superfamily putative drug exporter